MYFATKSVAAVAIVATIVVIVGCSSEPASSSSSSEEEDGMSSAMDLTKCPAGFIGDPSKEPVMELRALRADGSDVALHDGDDLAIALPPQGGRVSFAGVRVTNVDGCGIQIIGVMRDTISQQIRLDGRTVNLNATPDGWGTTGSGANIADPASIASYTNIPMCPNQWADSDIFDHPFVLEVEVTDRRLKKVKASITVVPRCAEPGKNEAECRCICKRGYILGEACGR